MGKPGVVIDGIAQVGVAGASVGCGAGLVPDPSCLAHEPVTAAVRHPAGFLHVHVD